MSTTRDLSLVDATISASASRRDPWVAWGAAALLAVAMAVGEIDGDRWYGVDRGDHVTLLSVIALTAVASCIVGCLAGPRLRFPIASAAWWGLGLVGWLGVAALFSPEPLVALVVALGLAAMAAAAARVVVLGGWLLLAWAVIAAASLFVVASLTVDGLDLRPEGRLQLLSLDPNQLGRLGAMVVLAATVLWNRGGIIGRLVAVGAGLGGLVATVDSSSRTAIAALALALVLLAWQRLDRLVVVVAIAIALGSVLLATPATLEDSTTAVLGREAAPDDISSLAGRTEAWSAAREVAVDHPLVGLGPGYDDEVFLGARLDGTVGWEARNAHSVAGHLVVVGGLPALLAALGALWAYTVAAVRRPLPFVDAIVLFLVIDGISEALISHANVVVGVLAGALVVRSASVVG